MSLYYRRTRFVSGCAGSNLLDDPAYDPARTGEADWADNFSELGAHSNIFFSKGISGGGSDSGVLATATFDIDSTHTFHIYAANSTWTNDLAEMDLEFLNFYDQVLAVISIQTTGNFGNYVRYGDSLANLAVANGAGYRRTDGTLRFSAGSMMFDTALSSNYNGAFTFACDGSTITKVRVSNARVKCTYTGDGSSRLLFQRYEAANSVIHIAGTVTSEGVPAARTVRLYDRATGVLVDTTVSDAVTGAFSLYTTSNGPFYVVGLDDDSGAQYNAKIWDYVTPV